MNKIYISLGCALLLNLQLSGCISASALPDEQRPRTWAHVVSKPHNFYQVSEHVYRSEQPSGDVLALLRQQNIQMVINLRASNLDAQVLQSIAHIQMVHIPINTWSISREELLQVMQSIEKAKQQNKNVLIHCYHGSDRTGASVAMYRIIFENWSREDALNEMKHGGYGFHPIWFNIEKLFSPENIKWIRNQLSNPS
ncbi:dual specificity protein phosphatase family protein [Acinetobacter gerneri]|uniref:dual specificity protein phosphatase family protein n=1 Tax=Acinetobacter gerneri TaxID=202952 RepID=UPI003AF7AF3E